MFLSNSKPLSKHANYNTIPMFYQIVSTKPEQRAQASNSKHRKEKQKTEDTETQTTKT